MPPNIGKELDFSLLPDPAECERDDDLSTEFVMPVAAAPQSLEDSASYWNWPAKGPTPSEQQEQQEELCSSTISSTTERSVSTQSREAKGLDNDEKEAATPSSSSLNPEHDKYWAEATDEDVNSKYFIDYSREIGRGHKTIVRKCIERQTGKRFAIKCVNKVHSKQVKEIKREAAILRRIGQHPHIAAMHDVLQDDNYFYVVTELCKGGELYDRVIAKAHSKELHYVESQAASIVRQIVEAVAFLHAKNVVHRDVKLENILLATKKGNEDVRLVDFGLSAMHNPETDPPLTEHVGTVDYVAPEVLHHRYTSSCDLWSIGVLTYALLSARSPFEGQNDAETYDIIKSNEQEVEFPSPDWDDISDTAKDFVRSLLQRDPVLRPSATELLQHEWLQQAAPPDTATSTSNKPFTMVQRFRKVLMPKRKQVSSSVVEC